MPIQSVHSERPSVQRSEFSTSDPAAAHAVMNEMYVGYRPRGRGAEDCTFDVRRTSAGGMSLDRLVHSLRMTAECDPFDYLLFIFPTTGNISITWGDREDRLGVGDAAMYPVGMPIDVSLGPLGAEILSIPLDAAERAATEQEWPGDVHFTGLKPVSPAMDRFWRSTVGFVAHQLETPGSPMSAPLVQARTRALLGAAALSTFPNTTMTADYRPGPGHAGPAALHRAASFIDAHADRPLTLSDIADAASASPRALQSAFAHHYDTSPLGYLRRVRLERAHRDLQAADPAVTTVDAIAAGWGFTTPGEFSTAYQEAYRRPPSLTLRT
ncbi:MAG: AraC family transcriptional regulator [Streptomyces sp.]|uniref:helix-turn-helix transcriptional regulator n=1 Tax=Streptomyces sp. TaxID=1931 RepID=UPI003D6A5BEF